jgi:hypothetical protein
MIEGNLDRSVLGKAIERVIERHEILRTTLHTLPGLKMPLQVIEQSATISLKEIDLRAMDPQAQVEKMESLFLEEGATAFSLENGPVLRASLLTLAAERNLLLISLPAILADELTLSNLFIEISSAYAAVIEGREAADKPLQYNHISEWLNQLLEEGDPAVRQPKSLDAKAVGESRIARREAVTCGKAIRIRAIRFGG